VSASPRQDIVLVISDLGMGGAQRVVSILATLWQQQGYRVQVTTFFGPELDHFSLPDGVSRHIVADTGATNGFLQGIINNIRRIYRLRAALKQANAPVVISFIGVTNILTVLASVGAPWRTIISERNDPERQSFGRIWDWLRRLTYRHADLITANSPGAVTTLQNFVPESKLLLVRNPIDLEKFQPPTKNKQPVICAAGRLVPQKSFDTLLAAFAKCTGSMKGWRLVIAGEGLLAATLHQQSADLGLTSRVTWLGRVDDCAPLFAEAAIFALPSRFEGTPNALLEAMASGCAVVVSDASSGPLDYVTHDNNGLVVPSDNLEALATALEHLALNIDLQRRLGAAARDTVKQNAQDTVVDEWSRLAGLAPRS
jgi:GalNAc-alpha-(1->4)-GalNAc-alpha-(1->3)-diNAcBac-PP-undecaprenol alpha-1,4-N-acetyl-D-galactosaminyltransferase